MKTRTWILVALVALLVLPSCRSRRKAVTPTTTPTTTMTTGDTAPPDIPTTVAQPDDFVTSDPTIDDPTVSSTRLPDDPVAATERAHQLGYIRDVYFEYDSSSLTPDSQEALAITASWLKSNPGYSLLIEGHCDDRGTEQYNLALGDRRANIARDYLATLGVPDNRLRTVSYGEEKPFVRGSGEAAWRQNRRAHLVLVGR